MTETRRRSLFRPCIDLHQGVVKQIVGASLRDEDDARQRAVESSSSSASSSLKTNFTSDLSSSHYANLYRSHNLTGTHVIKLGPKNDEAATSALEAWPGALQIGGGITSDNAADWIKRGAGKVIVTSYLFPSCQFSMDRLLDLKRLVGRDRLVVDVSCRRKGDKWIVAMNRWQDMTDMQVDKQSLDMLAEHCSEFLIHAADVEGLCQGIDEDLVRSESPWFFLPLQSCADITPPTELSEWVTIPTTYAGGARRGYL